MWQWKLLFTFLFVLQAFANFFNFKQRWVEEKDILRQSESSTITACKLKCDATPSCVASGFERVVGSQVCYLLTTSGSEKQQAPKEIKTKLMFVVIGNKVGNNQVLNEGFGETRTNKCPADVNGGYADWSAFSNCTSSYGGDIQYRNRSCANPAPQGGGKDCSELGNATNTRACCPATHKYAYAAGSYCCRTSKGINDAASLSDECACCEGNCSAKRLCTYNVDADFALDKPALQSSTSPNCDCSASSANDGNDGTMGVTQGGLAWWSVDMQMQVMVREIFIKLHLWALGHGTYTDLKIETRQTDGEQWKLCRQTSGRPTSIDVTVVCEEKTTSRYVKVTNGKEGMFRVRTVNVYGTV